MPYYFGIASFYFLNERPRNFYFLKKCIFVCFYLDRDEFQLGSLSHYLNSRAVGYMDLPTFPKVAPDSSVRNVEQPRQVTQPRYLIDLRIFILPSFYARNRNFFFLSSARGFESPRIETKSKELFYAAGSASENSEESGSESSDSGSSTDSEEESSGSESSSESTSPNSEDAKSEVRIGKQDLVRISSTSVRKSAELIPRHRKQRISSESDSSVSRDSSDTDDSDSSPGETQHIREKTNLDLLLELDGNTCRVT